MKVFSPSACFFFSCVCILFLSAYAIDATKSLREPRVKVIETGDILIDKLYPSMTGPYERVQVDTSDLDLITGFKTEVIDAGSGQKMGEEFFCHSQLQIAKLDRLIVGATGMANIQFPDGFGMPVKEIISQHVNSNEGLSLLGMVLNNHEKNIHRNVKIRTTINYWNNEDLTHLPDFKKLHMFQIPMAVEELDVSEGHTVNLTANSDAATHCVLVQGMKEHWLVPPGPQLTRRQFTEGVTNVSLSIHYAVVHLHNHGRYMRITDLTDGKILWQTDVIYEPNREQIAQIPVYSSVEGFPIYNDHIYEIETYYENASDKTVDAMAAMYVFYRLLEG